VGRQFFVQMPYRWFVLEAHSGLPSSAGCRARWSCHPQAFAQVLAEVDRARLAPAQQRQLASMFGDAEIRDEKWMGLTKSIMAVRLSAEHGRAAIALPTDHFVSQRHFPLPD
jgi:hypothetical protein